MGGAEIPGVNPVCPQIPESAPFSQAQRQWINGYLAGLFSGQGQPAPAAAPSLGPLLFLWGSQTGGAESLARKFAKQAATRGFDAKALGLDAAKPADLPGASRFCIVTSTYGDGDMPDNAQGFWDGIANGSAPQLAGTSYSVLSLGDSNYTKFCEAGKRFDSRLAELGSTRIVERVDCDVDEETKGHAWFAKVMETLAPDASSAAPAEEEKPEGYGKSNPFPAVLKTNRVLTGEGSAKETRHFEIVLDGSGIEYEVGDALGVVPTNCPDFVDEILDAAALEGTETVTLKDGSNSPLRDALVSKYDLSPYLSALPAAGTSAEDLVAKLRSLQHRLYSISSSPKAHPGEVHLTVGIVRYELEGRSRKGVCSTFLADRADGTVPVFIHKSPGFRLPTDTGKPVIMVGPGTGIAPFRAFLEERRATAPGSRNWLFFGDQHEATDFLYIDELADMIADGTLTRLDTAFSRDQAEKIYVQNRMLQKAAELWKWLEDGASFYVCGDAKRMAKDVDAALHDVIRIEGRMSEEDAAAYVARLKSEKRYQRDVY
ncbi:MAG: flavodoxin domain-containing protein [Akkermansiaceae bacterium]|nr:flavodoxin domain-containing protein [Akkermansiaceae bacterium]